MMRIAREDIPYSPHMTRLDYPDRLTSQRRGWLEAVNKGAIWPFFNKGCAAFFCWAAN